MKNKKLNYLSLVIAGVLLSSSQVYAQDYRAAAEKALDEHFQRSTLSREEQLAELEWFIKAAEPFRGMNIKTVAEGLTTHTYEAEVLSKVFADITGINIEHNIIGEGDVVDTMQTQMQSDRNIYDGYVNDSDAIGTHLR